MMKAFIARTAFSLLIVALFFTATGIAQAWS